MNFLLPPHLRAVLLKGGVLVLTLVAATLLYLWQHFVMVELGYRVARGRADLADLQHRKGELLVEVASLSSLDRIEAIARERLRMTTPKLDQLVRVIEEPAATPAGPQDDGTPVVLAASTAP